MEHITRSAAPRRQTGLFARISRMIALRRDRLALARMDIHLLTDIGLTEKEAGREAARPSGTHRSTGAGRADQENWKPVFPTDLWKNPCQIGSDASVIA